MRHEAQGGRWSGRLPWAFSFPVAPEQSQLARPGHTSLGFLAGSAQRVTGARGCGDALVAVDLPCTAQSVGANTQRLGGQPPGDGRLLIVLHVPFNAGPGFRNTNTAAQKRLSSRHRPIPPARYPLDVHDGDHSIAILVIGWAGWLIP